MRNSLAREVYTTRRTNLRPARRFLEGPGKPFFVLLQMTVLPYVMVALIRGLGSLNLADARTLARSVGA